MDFDRFPAMWACQCWRLWRCVVVQKELCDITPDDVGEFVEVGQCDTWVVDGSCKVCGEHTEQPCDFGLCLPMQFDLCTDFVCCCYNHIVIGLGCKYNHFYRITQSYLYHFVMWRLQNNHFLIYFVKKVENQS